MLFPCADRPPKDSAYPKAAQGVAARIFRQKRLDRAEAEELEDDRRVAVQLMASQHLAPQPILLTMRPMSPTYVQSAAKSPDNTDSGDFEKRYTFNYY